MLLGRRLLAVPSLLVALAAPAAPPVRPPLPAEHLDVATLPPASAHRIYIVDEAINNYTSARIRLYDGDSYRSLGQIDAGFVPGFAISPDGKTTAVATTYFSRGGHGTRSDVVEFTDNATLEIVREVVLPAKRAQTLPTEFNTAYSPDQRLLYIANLTPAASFTVVDVARAAVLSEIDTSGCVLVIPSGPRQVSSLCENGRLLTVTVGEDGREVARAQSAQFFDADSDPIFVQGVPTAGGVLFLSFLGDVHEVLFKEGKPSFATPWPLVTAKERGHWRPGGQQVAALHARSGRIYVPMHRGGAGSHKAGGTEIWVYDRATRKRLARWPIPAATRPVLAVQVSQDEHPLLSALTDSSDLLLLDATSGRLRHVQMKVGESCWYLLNP
jgi:methylamine dehydrogenase heavy chain